MSKCDKVVLVSTPTLTKSHPSNFVAGGTGKARHTGRKTVNLKMAVFMQTLIFPTARIHVPHMDHQAFIEVPESVTHTASLLFLCMSECCLYPCEIEVRVNSLPR